MPLFAFLPLLAFFLGTSLASIVFRVFSLLGIGIISFAGSQVFISELTQLFVNQLNSLPESFRNTLGYLEFDHAVSIVFSAYAIKLTLLTARRFLGVRS